MEIKNDLSKKLAEFASYTDNMEEVFENREQIEISRYYEKLPKPDLIATQEYIEGKIYYRNPAKEKEKLVILFSDRKLIVKLVSGMTIPAPYCLAVLFNSTTIYILFMIQRIQTVYLLIVTGLLITAMCACRWGILLIRWESTLFKASRNRTRHGAYESTWALFCIPLLSTIVAMQLQFFL